MTRLLTVKQAAAEYGIPAPTLYALIAGRKLPEVRLPGAERRVWLDRADLDKLIAASRQVRT